MHLFIFEQSIDVSKPFSRKDIEPSTLIMTLFEFPDGHLNTLIFVFSVYLYCHHKQLINKETLVWTGVVFITPLVSDN